MQNEFTAIIEDCRDGWFWAWSPEVKGANGQRKALAEAKADLALAIDLMLDYLVEKAQS